MNKFLKIAISSLLMLMLVSCNNKTSDVTSEETSSSGGTVTENSNTKEDDATAIKFTFDWNYTGGNSVEVNQTKNSILTSPSIISRDGYLFSYWAIDKDGKTAFDLSSKITEAKTLYAIWVESSNAVTVTFHNNYGENDVYIKMSVAKGSRLKSFPGTSYVRKGYYFKNWYVDNSFSKVASNMTKYDADADIYARWFYSDTFEAEYTKLTNLTEEEDPNINDFGEKIGHGYSSDVSGTGLIFTDANIGSECSNHYFICDLYYKNAFIEFDITANKATDDAILIAALSAEYFDMTFTKDNWIVEVNGQSLDYGTIVLDNVPTGRDVKTKRAFTSHTLSTAVSLKEGKNVIKLITNNSTRHDSTGTMAAEAPMIDCLTCYSDCELTFTAYNNI